MAGRVEMQFSTLPPAVPLVREGKLRALATTGAKRVSTLPRRTGRWPRRGLPVSTWRCGSASPAPAGTPPAIVAKLNREITAILNSVEVREALLQQGFVAEPAPPDYLAGRIGGDLGNLARARYNHRNQGSVEGSVWLGVWALGLRGAGWCLCLACERD